jgi:hypothetical protein
MAEYVILLPGDEAVWQAATAEERLATYARHREFADELAARGHRVTGGAELSHSSTARTVRATDGGVTVTDGPYAETVEQLTGFYIVESSDLDDLVRVCGILADSGGGVEVRATVVPGDAGGEA